MNIPKITLDDLQSDAHHLYHLLDATIDLLMEMPFERHGVRDHQIDRIAALAWIARDEAERIAGAIDANYRHLKGGQRLPA
jgi:hypothetical protein